MICNHYKATRSSPIVSPVSQFLSDSPTLCQLMANKQMEQAGWAGQVGWVGQLQGFVTGYKDL